MTPEAAEARAADYRHRAAAARAQAALLVDSAMRFNMLAIAQQWDDLAKAADETAQIYRQQGKT